MAKRIALGYILTGQQVSILAISGSQEMCKIVNKPDRSG